MKIAMGSDHGGYLLKEHIKKYLTEQGHEIVDVGCNSLDSCDYPQFGAAAARAVADGSCERGIVICTSGIGISISANKIKGIRCALLSDVMSARMTREHNDTNMMAIGAAVVGQMLALEIIDTWLGTAFSQGDRHQRRIDKMMALENEA